MRYIYLKYILLINFQIYFNKFHELRFEKYILFIIILNKILFF